MTSKRVLVWFTLSAFFTLLMVGVAGAGVRGKVKGTVKDTKGKPISDVSIAIQSLKVANEVYTIKTDDKGNFVYVGLKPYHYKVTFEKKGYQSFIQPDFKVRAGIWVELDVQLFTIKELKEQHFEELPPEQKANIVFNDAADAFNMNDFDQALTKLSEALEHNPDLIRAYGLMGVIYYTKKKDNAKAQETFEQLKEVDPESPTPYEYLGAIAHDAKDAAKAKVYWTKYMELGGDSEAVTENLAVILIKEDNLEEARKILEKGIEVQPESAVLYNRLAKVCMPLKDFECALNAYKNYIEVYPDAPDKNMVNVLIPELEKTVKKQQQKPTE